MTKVRHFFSLKIYILKDISKNPSYIHINKLSYKYLNDSSINLEMVKQVMYMIMKAHSKRLNFKK